MKTCFKCSKSLPLSAFYKHKKMGDGCMGKCKECTKKDTIRNRKKKIEYYRQYDRDRANLPKRKKLRKEIAEKWKKDPKLRKKMNAMKMAYMAKNKVKRAVHIITGKAIRDGKLVKQPCEVCGKKKVQAHHDDYNFPLSVRWLCIKHHAEHHKNEREKLRA